MNVEGQRSVVTWSGLPEELLNQVLTKLGISDYLNFRQVCSTWRQAAKQLKECLFSPLFMLPYYEDDQLHCFFFACPFSGKWYKTNRLEFDKNYECRGSFHGWLLMIDEDSGTIFLINPFTGVRVNLPQWGKSEGIGQFALSSAPTDPDCVIIILDHRSFKFCRIGDNEWTNEESKSAISNALVVKGKIYILGYKEPLSYTSPIAALSTTTLPELEFLFLPNLRDYYGWANFYGPKMVESNGEILLVVKKMKVSFKPEKKRRNYDFVVFKLDLSTSSWVEMKKIGNRVLFVGHNCSASFTPTALECGENQIYFVDDIDVGWGVFDMEDGSRKKGSSLSSSPFLNGVCIDELLPFWITPSFI